MNDQDNVNETLKLGFRMIYNLVMIFVPLASFEKSHYKDEAKRIYNKLETKEKPTMPTKTKAVETVTTTTVVTKEVELKPTIELKDFKIKTSDVQKDDFMLVSYFVKVRGRHVDAFGRGEFLAVTNIDTGTEFEVYSKTLIEQCSSADRFTETIKKCRTDIEKLFELCYNIPFTVCFDKQPDKKTGEVKERIMRGRLIGPAESGRMLVEDIDVPKSPKESGLRLVDMRTLKWLIVKGVKYVVK